MPFLYRFSLVALLLTLSACGFHLRGSGGTGFDNVDPAWRELALASADPNGKLSAQLRTQFTAAGANWVAPAQAAYTVHLGQEQFQQRYLTLSTRARAAEYQLTLSARFSVTAADGTIVIPDSSANTVRQMQSDPSKVVGKAEEVAILRREMRQQLVQQIIRRIQYYAIGQQN